MQKSQCRIGDDIKAEALRLGFDAVGFAHAAPVSHEAAKAFTQWIAEGKHDCMQWTTNYTDLRLDPTRLVEGAQTVISLAVNYLPQQIQEADAPQVARYAYGSDYHEVVRDMARQLAAYIKERTGHESRVCVDSAPILERYWAQQAGLGFIGLNTLLIIPQRGSFFFLCELVTTLPLTPDAPCTLTCGDCHACERRCPGGALSGGVLDALPCCLSCQTIENRSEQLPEWVNEKNRESPLRLRRVSNRLPPQSPRHPHGAPRISSQRGRAQPHHPASAQHDARAILRHLPPQPHQARQTRRPPPQCPSPHHSQKILNH
ncbi:MAG: DUF1730 domain-containing protein [Porphyromonadaceae bacterium]|nr:MAG: DUF1730 domain-containing protein [Porphyromonadaceae bacterium]